jgi:hypothetical protein
MRSVRRPASLHGRALLSRDAPAGGAAAPWSRCRLQSFGEPPLKVVLQNATVIAERHPRAYGGDAIRCEEQTFGESDRFPDPAAEREMKLTNQGDADKAGPGHPSSDATRLGPHVRDGVMRDQVVRPLYWRPYGK